MSEEGRWVFTLYGMMPTVLLIGAFTVERTRFSA